MPDDATEGVAEHSSRLQRSINLHAQVTTFMFTCSGAQCTTPNGWRLGSAPVQWSKPYSILAPTQDSDPGGRIQNHKRWPLNHYTLPLYTRPVLPHVQRRDICHVILSTWHMSHNMSTYDVTWKACYLTFWYIVQILYKQMVDSRFVVWFGAVFWVLVLRGGIVMTRARVLYWSGGIVMTRARVLYCSGGIVMTRAQFCIGVVEL